MGLDVNCDADTQGLYISAMLREPQLFARVNSLIKPEFFDPQFRKAVKFVQEYFQENRSVPAPAIFRAQTKVDVADIEKMSRGDIDYLSKTIAGFCQYQAMVQVLRTGPELIKNEKYQDLIEAFKAASNIKLIDNLGIDYLTNPAERILSAEIAESVISTGWRDVDNLIGGGVGRQELVVFLAPSGGGKSVNMLNLGVNFMEQGLKGVYVSIEMRDTKIAGRTDQMIAQMSSGMVLMNKQRVADEIDLFRERTGSRLFIKRMREGQTTSNDIGAYVRELEMQHGFVPDFIIGDYLDILLPARSVSGSNMFLKDQYVSEEFRGLGYDFDAIMVSGSQLGKHATEAINDGRKMHQGDVQGGSSKTNTADLMIATVKTDAMHEEGLYRFEFPKARNSDASTKTCLMNFNKETLRVSDYDASKLTLVKKERPSLLSTLGGPLSAKQASLDD